MCEEVASLIARGERARSGAPSFSLFLMSSDSVLVSSTIFSSGLYLRNTEQCQPLPHTTAPSVCGEGGTHLTPESVDTTTDSITFLTSMGLNLANDTARGSAPRFGSRPSRG